MSQATSTPSPLSAFERLHHWWQRIAASVLPGASAAEADHATSRVLGEVKPLFEESRAQRGGEISARDRAERIAAIYRGASLVQRSAILDLITHEFAPNRDELEKAIAAIQAAANDAELSRAEARLRVALNAPRAKFFTQFNLLPEGVKFLVDLRADLLAALPQAPALEVLRVELVGLLESWFDPGFLELRRIYWLADTSAHGMELSYGMMVSYRYEPSDVEKNHERFQHDGHIAAARRVLRLLDWQNLLPRRTPRTRRKDRINNRTAESAEKIKKNN